jgi:hypothetical protein
MQIKSDSMRNTKINFGTYKRGREIIAGWWKLRDV